MSEIILIAHNIRSTHNVGSIFRSCDGFGVRRIILSGYTPYPDLSSQHTPPVCAYDTSDNRPVDSRLPHLRDKITRQIHKTALGAEMIVPFEYHEQLDLSALKDAGYRLVALEQATNSINLRDYLPPQKIALLLGEEVDGIAPELLAQVDDIVEIPMSGQKESFNVSVACGVALYHLSSLDT